jgi:SIR2-like domain
MLLGSGSSVPARMPTVNEITHRVLSGENVLKHGSDFRVVDKLPPNHEVFIEGVREVVAFVGELKQLCDDYFRSQEKERATNYEDIAYVARQIDDGLLSEYENPALLPLNQRFSTAAGRTPDELLQLAGASADYIEDIVRSLLGRPVAAVDHVAAIVDAFGDGTVDDITLATLNHDVVLEHAFGESGTQYSDGFGNAFGTLRVWNDTFTPAHRKLLKLHGSINWWRYNLTRDGWTGQFTARATDGDPFHARGPEGELLEYPAGGRPQILTGTFNKILQYGSGIYADQHFRFHEALAAADALVVVGYGFGDKAINARIVAWAERPGQRKMIVIHPKPVDLGARARGAIRNKWDRWQRHGLLAFVLEYLSPATTWSSISSLLG